MRYDKMLPLLRRQLETIEDDHLRNKVAFEKQLKSQKTHYKKLKTTDMYANRMVSLNKAANKLVKAIGYLKDAQTS